MPAIDQDTCSEWTELDREMYHAYPYFLAKKTVERRKSWMTFGKLTKKTPWKPNHGPIMRGVRKSPSPHLRQFVNPQPLSSQPKEDIMRVQEVESNSILYWHDFSSPVLNFYPEFNDFLSHVSDHGEDIMEKMERFEELFYRTMMFHMAPGIFICVGQTMEFINAPAFEGTTVLGANDGKTTAWLAATLATYAGQIAPLGMQALSHGLTILETDLGIPPFSGSGLPAGDDKALDQKYALITHSEAWNRFTFDPYLQQHKNCNLDVVNDSFRGSLFGRMTSKLEDKPLFMKADGTFLAPEIEQGNAVQYNQGEAIPNPDYTSLNTSPFAWSWYSGNIGYESVTVGPPPSEFTKDTPPDRFPGMKWNGELNLTKDFLIECPDPVTGAIRYKTNSKGRHIKYEATSTYGIHPKQRRSIYPILHLRARQ